MAFVTMFLAVVYSQRQAPIAHKVFQTLEEVLVPKTDTFADSNDFHAWLGSLMQVGVVL